MLHLNHLVRLKMLSARNRAKKQAEQLKIGQRALDADPEGVNGYNAFVNEPAEDVARITLDETGDTVDFMATKHGSKQCRHCLWKSTSYA